MLARPLGSAALSWMLRMARSRTLASVPVTATVPARELAWLPSRMSELAESTRRLVSPLTVSAPVWVMWPPDLTLRFPRTLLVPRVMALVLVTLTSARLAPLTVLKEAAPPSVTLVSVMPLGAVVVENADVPVTARAAELVMVPPATVTLRLPETLELVPAKVRPPSVLRSVALPALVVVTERLLTSRSTSMPVLPALRVTWPELAWILPAPVVVMPPMSSSAAPDQPVALAVSVIVPLPCTRRRLAPNEMCRPAENTTLLLLPIVRLVSRKMSRVACRCNSEAPVTVPSTLIETVVPASANATSGVPLDWFVRVLPPLATSRMSSGSSSSTPPSPNGASSFTSPSKARACLPDTSTKPPLPPCCPPCDSMVPKKRVTSSDHTMTLPPSPSVIALALMVAS